VTFLTFQRLRCEKKLKAGRACDMGRVPPVVLVFRHLPVPDLRLEAAGLARRPLFRLPVPEPGHVPESAPRNSIPPRNSDTRVTEEGKEYQGKETRAGTGDPRWDQEGGVEALSAEGGVDLSLFYPLIAQTAVAGRGALVCCVPFFFFCFCATRRLRRHRLVDVFPALCPALCVNSPFLLRRVARFSRGSLFSFSPAPFCV